MGIQTGRQPEQWPEQSTERFKLHGCKKRKDGPQPKDKEERYGASESESEWAESDAEPSTEPETENQEGNGDPGRKESTRPNIGSYNEKARGHGGKASFPTSPTTTKPSNSSLCVDSGPLDPDSNAIPKVKALRKQNQNQKTEQNRKKENTDSGNRGTHRKEKTIGTWNIRRGLIKRENEIVEILTSQNIDVLFLTETDTKRSDAEKFVIKGFNTVMQRVSEEEDIVRVIALIRENTGLEIKTRSDLMSDSFPSVWLEIKEENKSSTLLGGFYRQWTNNGIRSSKVQVDEIQVFCNQIDSACTPRSKAIIMGDANLCSQKWQNKDFDKKNISQPLIQCLEKNGLKIQDVGTTYQSDNVQSNGKIAHTALDHVYVSESMVNRIQVKKLQNSATDHLPVIAEYCIKASKDSYKHAITKRSFKGFTTETWNCCLAQQDWLLVDECETVNEMVEAFNENIIKALDLVAPVKNFVIRSRHRFGLSDSTKELMKKRDRIRNSISAAKGQERATLSSQYKVLRNKVTSQIRKENIDYNNNRVEEANNEGELWKVAKEVLNPKKETVMKIVKEDGSETMDELVIAESFNSFFTEKIEQLKKNIDPSMVEDPNWRLREKMKGIEHKLEFKKVTQKQLAVHMKKLNKKKSSGIDGLSQENLILGKRNLLAPLTTIINKSIEEGEFPASWKEAVVTPVLKKGSPQSLNNYRPVSCLPAASKVLEIVVCTQLSEYLEKNDLLPKNQHGFRPKRSTMSAWQEIQLDWAEKTEQNLVTGVLLWDLSAAFDTLDCDGLCDKLALFGIQPRSVRWIRSFLTGRSQMVKVGNHLSKAKPVTTGVPQGGGPIPTDLCAICV
jgi:exonuclease III